MSRFRSSRFILIALLALLLGACDDDSDGRQTSMPTEEVKERVPTVDEFVCSDERDRAVAYATLSGLFNQSIPALWDDAPFVVDISSAFTNADELLDVVAQEAARIHDVLGYQVFVAGDVLPFGNLISAQLSTFESGSQRVAPNQRIEIRCCFDGPSTHGGTSYPWWRMILLASDEFQSRHAIAHELWHLLGFTHHAIVPSVLMSDILTDGPEDVKTGARLPTVPDTFDLAKLACIYD